MCDSRLQQHVSPEVLAKFSTAHHDQRKRSVLQAMTKDLENPTAWIAACVNNVESRELERRLTGVATPQHSSGGYSASPYGASPRREFSSPVPSSASSRKYVAILPEDATLPMLPASSNTPLPNQTEQSSDVIPEWVPELHKLFPDNRSDFLRSVMKRLPADVLKAMQSVQPRNRLPLLTHGCLLHIQMRLRLIT